MSTLIERLTELGFTQEEGMESWEKPVGWCVVQVRTLEYEYLERQVVETVRENPIFQIHMHHSCDEWVIDSDTDPSAVVQTALKFSTDVAEAAALLAQVVA